MANINDYVLVRDKDGNLKYYKDGRFFDIEEIEGEKKAVKKTDEPLPKIRIFEQEEDEEVKKLKDLEGVRSELNSKIQKTINDIVAELKISFSDEKMEQRFKNLLTTRLRNIRDDKEVKYMMAVPKEEGGLGLDAKKAEVILAILKKHEEPLIKDQKGLGVKTAQTAVEARQTEKRQKDIINEPAIKKRVTFPVVEEKPWVPTVPTEKNEQLKTSLSETKESTPATKKEPSPPPPQFTVRRAAPTMSKTQKPQVSDVQYKPKLMGPLDELKYLDLDDFHRLGKNIQEMTAEIQEKVELLKEEDFVKGLDGIKAWRQSAVYKIYSEMGIDSIMTGKSIEQVIIDRQVQNKPTLTQSEFEAIMDLNKKLEI